ncbi:nitroreductase family deazaflavin-dependent oxidoreductase [Mycobacterium sp. 852002-51961_SCH5331710]|uniref:nitroreductase family deazaflavin-dependent oxidoreductase n=1 Tax=Mycobacterium sp. 852002-51961_SCH5331710 TaxID=1834105 RepID=UPI0007FB87BE|nr:nitroreductase family deazaflavin-dependent oxidoreductase [Mycobacterium sp. 852002-51961_SCH5331710]OBB40515.1 nitroreductase [Mycobacterium sp. 852002-51961_SCH5331710]
MGIPEVRPDPPTPLVRAGARLMGTAPARWFLGRIGWRIDRAVIKLTNGHVSMSLVLPEVLLTHTGAKSGQQRSTPLTYFTDAGRVIVIASNYGGDRHPAWFHNVKANPRVTLSARGYRGTFVGEEVTGAERDRLFGLAKQFVPNYADYEKRAGKRRIPVVAFTEAEA